jgi:sugar lactone lactonase YvrE
MAHRIRLTAAALVLLVPAFAKAHPGSGIVVTPKGEVYFVDNSPPPPEGTGRGIVWKLTPEGKMTSSSDMGGGHWMAFDASGAFQHADLAKFFRHHVTPNFQRVTPPDFNPSLITTDACPFVLDQDRNLYFANHNTEITRLSPDGQFTDITPKLRQTTEKLGGITGLACGPDGSLYAACPSAILKITTNGSVATIVHPIELKDCDHTNDSALPDPSLRGLSVDANGNIYAAASSCRRVVKITPRGKVTSILQSERPWLPTGIAIAGGDAYILEFTDETPMRWRPRVRKLQANGKVTVLATISR